MRLQDIRKVLSTGSRRNQYAPCLSCCYGRRIGSTWEMGSRLTQCRYGFPMGYSGSQLDRLVNAGSTRCRIFERLDIKGCDTPSGRWIHGGIYDNVGIFIRSSRDGRIWRLWCFSSLCCGDSAGLPIASIAGVASHVFADILAPQKAAALKLECLSLRPCNP